MTRIAGLS